MDEKQFQLAAERVRSLQSKNPSVPTLKSAIDRFINPVADAPVCPVCGDLLASNQCRTCEREKIRIAKLRERRKAMVQGRRNNIKRDIPPLYEKATIRTLNKKIVQVIRQKPKSQGLVLWGDTGTGKTWTACALWRDALASGKTVVRRTYRELLIEIRSCYAKDEPEDTVLNKFIGAKVLIIDDLAACKNTEFAIDAILHIIDKRIEQCLPTIITSNLSPENIEQIFGERLGSRLKTFLTIKLGGKDKRG